MKFKFALVLCISGLFLQTYAQDETGPNIVFIFCDDLNRSGLGSLHDPLVDSPHIDSLYQESVVFTNAHATATSCGPSRASIFSGIHPLTSGHYGYRMGLNSWRDNEILDNAHSVFQHFKENGYRVYAAGKVYHQGRNRITDFDEYYPTRKQGPYPYNRLPHSDLPLEFDDRDLSFSPLEVIPSYPEFTGWRDIDGSPFFYESEENRDLMADEQVVAYADSIFTTYSTTEQDEPFFLTLGLFNPHEPFHVPQKYFDRYPLDSIDLDLFLSDDIVEGVATRENRNNAISGFEAYDIIVNNAPEEDEFFWLKRYIQGYYASISYTDDRLGEILASLEENQLDENTIVVFSSDHGLHLGEKKLLKKTSLWNGATQVPLMMRIPGREPAVHFEPVSLIDIYPTFVSFANLPQPATHNLDGQNLDDILATNFYDGTILSIASNEALPLNTPGKQAHQHHCILIGNFKYILHSSGEDELYKVNDDPNETNDLSQNEGFHAIRAYMHSKLSERVSSLREPVQDYHQLFYGDFEQDFNGWRVPNVATNAILAEGNDLLPTPHLRLLNESTMINRVLEVEPDQFYTLSFDAYNENNPGTVQVSIKYNGQNGNANLINESISLDTVPAHYSISFFSTQEYENERLFIESTSPDPLRIDNIELVNEDELLEALFSCEVEPQLLPSNQPFSQLSADSLFILPDQPDFFAENTPQLSKQTWYSITPNSSLGLIATRIIGSGNAVIELWDGCDAPTPVETANDRSGRIETLLVDSLEIGTTYRVRVADAKTNLDLESRTRTTYVDLFKAEVLDISDSQIFTSDINYALFNPNQIRFKFTPLNESFDEFIAFRAYNPGNSYDLNSFGLEDTEYLVSVSYRLVPLAIIVPYGESFLYSPGMSGIIAEADIPPAFEVFPNPKRAGDSHVFIKPSESRSASTIGIRLMDYQGRVLSEMNGLEANSTHLLEIPQHLNTGVYLVQILEDSGQSHVLKLQL